MKEERLMELAGLITEATKSKYEIFHNTFTSAVGEAEDYAVKNGYEIDENDWFNSITTGSGKPRPGKTFKASIVLIKNGKEQKKRLHIQVYNRETDINPYELNCYIS